MVCRHVKTYAVHRTPVGWCEIERVLKAVQGWFWYWFFGTSFLCQNWINWSGKTKHNTPRKCPWKGTSFPSKHFLCGYSDSFDKTNSARHCTFRSRGLSAIQESEKVWKSVCHLQIKYLAATIARSWGKSRWHLFITLWPQPISTSVRQQSTTCCSLTDANC
jgi:hypothetical protein